MDTGSAWRTPEQADAEREWIAAARAARGVSLSPDEAEDDESTSGDTFGSGGDYRPEDYERYLDEGYSEDAARRRASGDEALRAEGYSEDVIRDRTYVDDGSPNESASSATRPERDQQLAGVRRGDTTTSDSDPGSDPGSGAGVSAQVADPVAAEPEAYAAADPDPVAAEATPEDGATSPPSVQPRRRSYRLGPPLPAPARRTVAPPVDVPGARRVPGVVGPPVADAPRNDTQLASVPRTEFAFADRGVPMPPAAAPQETSSAGAATIVEMPAAAAPAQDLDVLAGQLYGRIRGRLRAELLIDRERAALLTDLC